MNDDLKNLLDRLMNLETHDIFDGKRFQNELRVGEMKVPGESWDGHVGEWVRVDDLRDILADFVMRRESR